MARQEPQKPLPRIPGKTQKDFPSRRAYLNARAQAAGYRNYKDWLAARRAAGIPRKNTGRARRPNPQTDNFGATKIARSPTGAKALIWNFVTPHGTIPDSLYEQHRRNINRFFESLTGKEVFQVFILGKGVSGETVKRKIGRNREEFQWFPGGLASKAYNQELMEIFEVDNPFDAWLEVSGVSSFHYYDNAGHYRWARGILEFHVAVYWWNYDEIKEKERQRKSKRR
ncbi:MAG: hypothetical protein IRZ03_18560 [Acidobacterium ailaaui]|nr:hypothetical protein [Pseudacidobacterium ailaaui]